MTPSGLWVLIPVKDLVNAKQRLSGVLSPSERRALCQAMVEDMLQVLQGVDGIEGILLVSDDPAAELLAYRYGARVLREKGHSKGLNAAVQQAADHLAECGGRYMLVLHGDLPAISAADVRRLISALRPHPWVRLAPDSGRQGTNGLLCSLPAPLSFCYGEASLHRHRDACKGASIPCEILELPSLQLDIDTPADLQQLLEVFAAGAGAGGKTRAVAQEYQLASRLRQMQLNEMEEQHASARPNAGVDHGN